MKLKKKKHFQNLLTDLNIIYSRLQYFDIILLINTFVIL